MKNFIGEYYYEDDKLFLESNIEIDDLLTQLRRTESLLRQLLQYYDFTIPVQSAIVFINPEFTLSQAPRNLQLLLPTQLNRYMKQFHRPTSMNPISYQIAEKLEAIKLTKPPFIQLPTYHFNELKKGIRCKACRGLSIRIIGKRYICGDCGEIGLGQDVILQNIKEFLILFPKEKLTSQIILEWCGRKDLKRRIQYLLHNHFVKKSLKKGTYYVTK